MKWPMTMCLTFDDGFKIHHDAVAPLLEAHGWRGAFNVPTDFLDVEKGMRLSPEQLADCCLTENGDNFMTWDDARDLEKRGHEVYPHTMGHVDLVELEKIKNYEEITHQIAQAKDVVTREMGHAPRFFCSPHNSQSKYIAAAIRHHNMELLNCCRPNIGLSDPVQDPDHITVDYRRAKQYIVSASRAIRHLDIMMHGIDEKRGGWCPFPNVSAFEQFLDEVAEIERLGVVRVVSYDASHRRNTILRKPLKAWDEMLGKIRACAVDKSNEVK